MIHILSRHKDTANLVALFTDILDTGVRLNILDEHSYVPAKTTVSETDEYGTLDLTYYGLSNIRTEG